MRLFSTIAMLTTLTAGLPVAAQTGTQPAQKPADSGNLPVVVALNAADCRRLVAQRGMVVQHQADPGVAYQPGRDVDSRGRPIAPADLPSATPPLLNGPIELPVRLPLSALSGLPSQIPSGMADESKLRVATVSVDTLTGKLAINGKPMEPPAEDAVAVACRDYLSKPQERQPSRR